MLAFALAAIAPAIAPPTPMASPQRILGTIRAVYRSHRPPPPFETYTLTRKQNATNGYPDPVGTYTKHYWVRNSDRAALSRLVFRDEARGPFTFDRPAFNEDRDPGPPTADVFEPAPARKHPVSEVPTPEPQYSPLPVIGGVSAIVESDYQVRSLAVEGDQLHLYVYPIRDVERNRLREIFADKNTLALRKLIATDKLFVDDGRHGIFPVTFTITMGTVQGIPVVTSIHGEVGGGYHDDGQLVDYNFTDITFPASLPEWYFDPRTYGQHKDSEPS